MSSPRSRVRLLLSRLGLVVGGIAAAFVIGELAIRTGIILPNRQVIRGPGTAIRLIDGVPVWLDGHVGHSRENIECVQQHPERTRILFAGTSITHGAAVALEETFPKVLEQELNRLRPVPGFCVMNFAQAGFADDQRYVITKEQISKYHPALVLDQDWYIRGSPGVKYFKIGDGVYALGSMLRRADGLPGLTGVPDLLNAPLFLHSRLYEWLVLAHGQLPPFTPPPVFASEKDFVPPPGPIDPSDDPRYHEEEMIEFANMVRSGGARPGFFVVADWSYPLSETSPHDKAWIATDLALGQKNGFDVLPLRPLLADQDGTKLRLDSWHMNAAGHRAVGGKLVPFVLHMLDEAGATNAAQAKSP